MTNTLSIIASTIVVTSAIFFIINFITKKLKAHSEMVKSERVAKNILDSYRENNSK